MNNKELRRYLRQNPALKNWLKANNQWFKEHPQAYSNMLNNPSFLSSFGQSMHKNRRKLQRRLMDMESKRPVTSSNKPKPKLSLPSLSTINEKLSQTSEFIHGIQSFMKNVK